MKRLTLIVLFAASLEDAMAEDIDSLWDFSNPQVSEQRFRQALKVAQGDYALILQTQIARTYSIRGDFQVAREILSNQSKRLKHAGAEVQVRHLLETGRTYASAAHAPEQLTPEDLSLAAENYLSAFEQAQAAGLDALAIDALHMMAFVDSEPEQQLLWANRALDLARSSEQPKAKAWQAPLLNNAGYALHQLGRYAEALAAFEAALEIRERGSNEWATHVARWMVAWTLRALGRIDEALAMQLELEREGENSGRPDEYVFEELELLYRAIGNLELAAHYAAKVDALSD